MSRLKPKICFVGNMLGRNPGFVTTQGQIVADLFAAEGYAAVSVSSRVNKAARLADIVGTLVRRRRDYDLVVLEVYSGLSMTIAAVTGAVCRLLGAPLVAVLHGGNLPDFARRHPVRVKRVLAAADALVAPSGFLAAELDFLGFDIRVVPNVLRLEDYEFRPRRAVAPRLVWMRSFHPLYNPPMALEAFAEIHRAHPAATLVMAGVDKGLEPEMKALAARLGLADAVRFPGFLDAAAKAREFAAADVYLNTNRVDNMPVSVVEACAFGLPVVATRVGGLPFLVEDGETALLVGDDRPAEMAAAVEKLLADEELCARLSQNGRRLAEKSSWRRVKPLWEAIFGEVLRARQMKRVVTARRTNLTK